MDLLAKNNEALVSAYFPFMRDNITELCLHGKLGLMSISAKDITGEAYTDQKFSHHLKLKIPFAGKKLQWEVIFNPEDMEFAPDFDFNDDLFMFNTDIDAWALWDINDPKSMTNVLKEFLNIYKQRELDKLASDNSYASIKEAFEDVLVKKELSMDEVEVFVENNNVHMLISLNVDYTSIPTYVQKERSKLLNPGDDYVLLRVTYLGSNHTNTCLFLSPRMEQVLIGGKQFHIPEYNKEKPLVDYLDNVSQLVHRRIQSKIVDHQKRKRFIAHMVALNPDELIDYDNEQLMSVTIIYVVDNYDYLLDIIVDDQFPHKKPKIMVSHECEQPNCKETIENYPWNKNNSEKEIINNILTFLQEELPELRKNHKH